MTDLVRLMFDDGASRKPVTPYPALDKIYFTFKGHEYVGTIFDTVESVRSLFNTSPQRGGFYWKNRNCEWGIPWIKANPSARMAELYADHALSPGRVYDEPHLDLIEENCVFMWIREASSV